MGGLAREPELEWRELEGPENRRLGVCERKAGWRWKESGKRWRTAVFSERLS